MDEHIEDVCSETLFPIKTEESLKLKTGSSKKIYKQRYLQRWEEDPRFRIWLSQSNEDDDYAFCNLCNTRIVARIASLISHNNSSKHKRRLGLNGMDWCPQNGPGDKMKQKEDLDASDYVDQRSFEEDDGQEESEDLDSSTPRSHYTRRCRTSKVSYKDNDMIYDDFDHGDLDNKSLNKSRGRRKLSHDDISPKRSNSRYNNFHRRRRRSRSRSASPRKEPEPSDAFSVYGNHVANELRQVDDSYAQQASKMRINTILFEARTGQYNRHQMTMASNHTTITSESPEPNNVPQNGRPPSNNNPLSEVSSPYQIVVCPPVSSIS